MPSRFVIQKHTRGGESHYDFMLEDGARLASWRMNRLAGELGCSESALAQALPDHRLAYLIYEGPVSGGRGVVKIADSGTYTLARRWVDGWVIQLSGQSTTGTFEFRRQDGEQWVITRLA
jgi:hypothetical protein